MRASVTKPNGLIITTPWDGGPETQQDTVQCVHCGQHWVWEKAILSAIQGGLGFCTRCNGITCGDACQACVPQEQQLENIEAGRLDWKEYRPIRVSFSGCPDHNLS